MLILANVVSVVYDENMQACHTLSDIIIDVRFGT